MADDSRSEGPAESFRLDRRAAMKAALGGAVAGAAFVAPRVAGFSVAPDYAAAASCIGDQNTSVNRQSSDRCLNVKCWGNFNSGGICACNCNAIGPLSNSVANFNLTVNGSGGAGGVTCGKNGTFNIAINGIDPPFQTCTVNVNGNCPGTFLTFNGAGPLTYNSSSSQTVNSIGCNGGDGTGARPSVTINMTCVCN